MSFEVHKQLSSVISYWTAHQAHHSPEAFINAARPSFRLLGIGQAKPVNPGLSSQVLFPIPSLFLSFFPLFFFFFFFFFF
jgi:hypothetical protein